MSDDVQHSGNDFSRLFMVKEAVHSVAMEHARDCDCLTCRAANGDDEAFGKVLQEAQDASE